MPTSELSYKSADGTKIVAYRSIRTARRRGAVDLLTHGMGRATPSATFTRVLPALNGLGLCP